MEILLGLIVELLLQLVFEVAAELGGSSVKATLGRENHNPVLATIGFLILGGLVGLTSIWLFPTRVLRPGPVPGLSLILNPIAGGSAMHVWGEIRRAGGHPTTNLATFYGGAALAFGISLARFLGTT